MWTRAELKKNAKMALKGNWINAIIVSLIASILGVGAASHAANSSSRSETVGQVASDPIGWLQALLIAGIAVLGVLIAIVVAFAIMCFLTNVVEVGRDRFYLKNRGANKPEIRELFSAFKKDDNYFNVVKTMMMVTLKIFVGFLCLCIPGIYLSYVYRMVPFIMAVNPNMDPYRAQELSRDMMNGHKLSAFILDFSFIGWDILSALIWGLGNLLLDPYKAATNAELYTVLREYALANGIATEYELPEISNGVVVEWID